METNFRQSMSWLHTWAGVVIGSILFAIFWMGSLSVFDREIDRWMMPDTRLPSDQAQLSSVDDTIAQLKRNIEGSPQKLWLNFPTARTPLLEFWHVDAEGEWRGPQWVNPTTGELLRDQGTEAGTGFIFPFHYRLHIRYLDIGYWLVGLAGMAMLALLISGVVIHRRIFKDFFVFRPEKKLQRSSLDLHNLSGVLALPFHFIITLSGLIIFINIYFPKASELAYAGHKSPSAEFFAEGYGEFERKAAGSPAQTSASIDAMLAAAEKQWSGGRPHVVQVWYPGDANGLVSLHRSYADQITMNLDEIYFDSQSGEILNRFEAAPIMSVQRFISGLHFIQFNHWALRWLYFVAGLSGCVMIATGFLFWLETRRKRHAKTGAQCVRIVESLTIGSVTGIIISTFAFFVSNRVLPLNIEFAGQDRATLEMWIFYLTWVLTFVHAALRARRAWGEQCVAIAALALLAVGLNAISTGEHIFYALSQRLWAVAGMDFMLLLSASIALITARRLRVTRYSFSISKLGVSGNV